MNAADAAWCREVVDTVLELLRPHTPWYAAVHRINPFPQWSVLAFALYLAFLALILFRERIFPAADRDQNLEAVDLGPQPPGRRQLREEGVDQAPAACRGRLLPHPVDGLRGNPEPHLAAVRVEVGPEPEGLRVGFPAGLARRQRPRAAGQSSRLPLMTICGPSPVMGIRVAGSLIVLA